VPASWGVEVVWVPSTRRFRQRVRLGRSVQAMSGEEERHPRLARRSHLWHWRQSR
jgi:hypothetical protein